MMFTHHANVDLYSGMVHLITTVDAQVCHCCLVGHNAKPSIGTDEYGEKAVEVVVKYGTMLQERIDSQVLYPKESRSKSETLNDDPTCIIELCQYYVAQHSRECTKELGHSHKGSHDGRHRAFDEIHPIDMQAQKGDEEHGSAGQYSRFDRYCLSECAQEELHPPKSLVPQDKSSKSHDEYFDPAEFVPCTNEACSPAEGGSNDSLASCMSPDRGTQALPDEGYAIHARPDVSSNHTMVAGHGADIDEVCVESVHCRFVQPYTAGKDTTCPYRATRFVTSTVTGEVSFEYAPVYGPSIACNVEIGKVEKTLKSCGNVTVLQDATDTSGAEGHCHHPTIDAAFGIDGVTSPDCTEQAHNVDSVNSRGNSTLCLSNTSGKHPDGRVFVKFVLPDVPDNLSVKTVDGSADCHTVKTDASDHGGVKDEATESTYVVNYHTEDLEFRVSVKDEVKVDESVPATHNSSEVTCTVVYSSTLSTFQILVEVSCCSLRENEVVIDDSKGTRVRGSSVGGQFAEKGDLSPLCSVQRLCECYTGNPSPRRKGTVVMAYVSPP